MEPVRDSSEIAHDHGISTDYHINEMPIIEQRHFRHLDDKNPTYIRPEDQGQVCELLDWLIEKQKAGHGMTDSIERLAQMKEFMHAELEPWNCRAGQNTLRVEGALAPCFPMYSATHDWGVVGSAKFDKPQLDAMKTVCQKHCFSTLNHIVGYCYNDRRLIQWLLRQASPGFQGVRGNFE